MCVQMCLSVYSCECTCIERLSAYLRRHPFGDRVWGEVWDVEQSEGEQGGEQNLEFKIFKTVKNK